MGAIFYAKGTDGVNKKNSVVAYVVSMNRNGSSNKNLYKAIVLKLKVIYLKLLILLGAFTIKKP